MNIPSYLQYIENPHNFDRTALRQAMATSGIEIGDTSYKYHLNKLLKSGIITRIGRNRYCISSADTLKYDYRTSRYARKVMKVISTLFPSLTYTLMETAQLNEFLDQPLEDNIFFLSVEAHMVDFIFAFLQKEYPNTVLNNPTAAEFRQNRCHQMIVIEKLISEAPLDKQRTVKTRLEKLLVDTISDKLIYRNLSEDQLDSIFVKAFETYGIDESCLIRYARRRGSYNRMMKILERNNIAMKTK